MRGCEREGRVTCTQIVETGARGERGSDTPDHFGQSVFQISDHQMFRRFSFFFSVHLFSTKAHKKRFFLISAKENTAEHLIYVYVL